MNKIILSVFIFSLSWPLTTLSHGDLGYSGKHCQLSFGAFTAKFTGYQPRKPHDSFCNDVPEVGRSFVTLDFLDNTAGGMKKDFRIINNPKNLGNGTKISIDDLGSKEELQAATILYLESKLYPTGIMVIDSTLDEGHYIGIATVFDADYDDNSKIHTAIFPFTVGFGDSAQRGFMGIKSIIQIIFLIMIALIIGIFYSMTHDKKDNGTPS